MRLSWPGVLLAPVVAPALFAVSMALSVARKDAWLLFLLLLAPGGILSYATMFFLYLPGLFALSCVHAVRGIHACLLGLVIGSAVFVPMTWLHWLSSGPDSGPPQEAFSIFLLRWAQDPFVMVYPVAGLVTSALYWAFGTWRLHRATTAYGGA